MRYHIWTLGCQMNVADTQRLASELERLGHQAAADHDEADILVINTCVVRQSAEDKAYGRLRELAQVKRADPGKVIGLMGCLVGVKDPLRLREKLPQVDVFLPPSDPAPMVAFLGERAAEGEARAQDAAARAARDHLQDSVDEAPGAILLPEGERGTLVSAHVPVVYGCSHACTFCIIPYRRGVEKSRPVGEIVGHVRSLARQGVREVTLLGQIVDRYGKDVSDGPNLSALLRIVHDAAEQEGLQRIRFLTSHPNWMTDELLDAVAGLPRVMPQIEVPVQAGSDEVLARMRRGYTAGQYRDLVARIRARIPGVAIHCDVIVGFPGETEAQFQETYDLLADLKLDKVHLARYSPRPHTVSARTMPDDVPAEEKKRRLATLEALQEQVVAEINRQYLGQTVEVLVEDQVKGKWRGRTPQNKLVFFGDDSRDWRGQLAQVQVTWTGPWSMQARLVDADRAPTSPASVEATSPGALNWH
ncbi:MAG: tRNA (N6-isopentenyl adenosine(37)-C2)-methylthiotransferase MiaB [Anaerolineae bacterium]|nr:tRNA (N6-isopentenyl adenosine(37)-C2)-methylthiotransferase MiaB [Anaerolineae bacterium]